ncbi:hypothetical protein, conserved [Plasmodium gonderi]|uniref:Uncharacterized protein n=1 Tax=Plasmodium gonderi TaxID=77519 RepID=A0A1Y1JC94_PLAGO|nr:hypothetical protein, conserved [Plasmodium gonderi]GAW80149.1 hypothetical protein, conserved [Plasmodium gonderi]
MKKDKIKEELKENNENYLKFNENARKWFYSKVEKNKMVNIQEKYESFLKSYENRKKRVAEKYNIHKYITTLNNILLLCFITFDFFYNLLKVCIKNAKCFYNNPFPYIYNAKVIMKKNYIYGVKLINMYKDILHASVLFVLREKKKIYKELKNILLFLFRLLNFYFFQCLEAIYQYFYFRYCDIFKATKFFKVFT